MGGLDSTDISVIGLLVLFHLGWGFRYTRPVTRASEREVWARRHRAQVPPEWFVEVDRQLRSQRRLGAADSCCFVLILYLLPTAPARTWVAWLAVAPGLLVLGRGLVIAQAAAVQHPGSRVARARQAAISDYLSPRERIATWAALVGVGVVIADTAVQTSSTVLVLPFLLVMAAAVMVEGAGVRFARMPEPAGDANQLYVQDAFRADALRGSLVRMLLAAFLLSCGVPHALGLGPHRTVAFLEILGAVFIGLCIVAFTPDRPVARMRARLWPTLGPDQLVMPDHADLSQGVTP